MMGSNHLPATLLRGKEQVDEIRVGNAEQRVDSLSFEELQDAFVNFDCHDRKSRWYCGYLSNRGAPVPIYFARLRWKLVTFRSWCGFGKVPRKPRERIPFC